MHRSHRPCRLGLLLLALLLLFSGCTAQRKAKPEKAVYTGNITVAADYRAVEFPFEAETLSLCGLSLGSREEAGMLLREYTHCYRGGQTETECTEQVDGLWLGSLPVTDCRVLRRNGELRSISLTVRYPDSLAAENGTFLAADSCTRAVFTAVCDRIARAGFAAELLEKKQSVTALFFLRDGAIVSVDAVQGYDPLATDRARIAPLAAGADAVLSLRWIRNDTAEFDDLFRVSPDLFTAELLYCDEIPCLKGDAA